MSAYVVLLKKSTTACAYLKELFRIKEDSDNVPDEWYWAEHITKAHI